MKTELFFLFLLQSLLCFSQERRIDGIFENSSKNIVILLNRQLTKDTLSSDIQHYSKFEIKVNDKKYLTISLIHDIDSTKIERTYKYTVENNSYLLKNKNTKPLLIPYIFGSLDTQKLYLSIDADNNLIINTVERRSGAVLLIGFLDWKTTQKKYVYNRIK